MGSPPPFSLPQGAKTFTDLQTYIATQQQLEGAFDSAFIAAAYEFAQLGEPDLTRLACQIAMIESEHRAFGRRIAGLEGYQTISLTSLREAADTLPAPDGGLRLFLLDMMLVGTTGIEVAHALRAAGFGDTPMIAMSASDRMLKAASDSQLFAAIVAKPFDLTHLLETVRRVTHQAA